MKEEVAIFIPKEKRTPSESSKDDDRLEMPWMAKQEEFILKIKEQCDELSKQHTVASKSHKKKYIRYSVPAIVLPIVCGAISNLIPKDYEYINGITLSITGILTGINTFFNHGKKTEKHNEYAGRYAELAGFIATELSKPKKFRIQLDVYLQTVTGKYNDLNNSAPML